MLLYRSLHQAVYRRWFFISTILVVSFMLAACGSRFSLPGAQPATQSVAVVGGQFHPTLALSPTSGHGGVYVQATGSGWPPNMMVVVALTDPSGISTTVASSDTDATGNLATGFLYPIDERWLISGPYTILAGSADGQFEASAQFTVVEPGDEAASTPLSTPSVTTTTTVAQAATPTPASTPLPTPTLESVATEENPEEVEAVEAATGNQPPILKAGFIPAEQGPDHWRFYVEAAATDPDNNLGEVVAILQLTPVAPVEELKLNASDEIRIKMDGGRIEISAPDPQALLNQIQQNSGIPIQNGQLIEFKLTDAPRYNAEIKEEMWRIEAQTLVLQVTATDLEGVSQTITASPPLVFDEDEHGPKKDKEHGKDKDKDKGNHGNGNGGGDDEDENEDEDD